METKRLFDWYIANQDDLVAKFADKYLLIHGVDNVDAYDTESDAYFDGIDKYGAGHFLVQFCTAGEEAYTQVFTSRAIF